MQRQESIERNADGAGLDLARLEKELATLWSEASGEGETAQGVMRACVLNLVVYASVDDNRANLDTLLDEVYESNPSRAILIIADPSSETESLDAFVSTRCTLSSKGAKQVCGEQITIEAKGAAVSRAASAIEPILVPDVPVFLWWKDIPHYEDKLFERLLRTTDRLLIDSSAFDHPGRDLLRLSEVLSENPHHLAFSDLNWGRLTAWRSLVAGFWDVAEYKSYLEQIERVEITFDEESQRQDQIPASVILIVGWLASRLGWEVEVATTAPDKNRTRFNVADAMGREIEIVLSSRKLASTNENGLHSINILTGAAQFSVELKQGGDQLETLSKIGDGERMVGRLLSFEEQSEGRRLSGELFIRTRDRVYEQAVACGGALLRRLGFE